MKTALESPVLLSQAVQKAQFTSENARGQTVISVDSPGTEDEE